VTTDEEYPEAAKFAAAEQVLREVPELFEWLARRGIVLGYIGMRELPDLSDTFGERDAEMVKNHMRAMKLDKPFVPLDGYALEELLYEFCDIDRAQLEHERRVILEAARQSGN
jgi:hypothetical protein